MNSHRIAGLLSQPWAFHRDSFDAFVLRLISEKSREDDRIAENHGEALARPKMTAWGDPIRQVEMRDSLAIIPIDGAIVKGASMSDQWLFGMTSDENIREDIHGALAGSAKSVLLDFNSPGGTVMGMEETSGLISAIQKLGIQVFSFSEGLMTSKAMGMAVRSMGTFTTPSAISGSVGVISASIHIERMLENAGIKVEVSASGDLKAAGEFKNLSEAQRANREETVSRLAESFFTHVKANRPNVKEEVFRGGYGDAQWALSNGLIDGIVNSRREVEDMILGST